MSQLSVEDGDKIDKLINLGEVKKLFSGNIY